MKKTHRLWWAVLCLLLLCACGQRAPAPAPEEPEPAPAVPHVIALECSDGELTLRFRQDEAGTWIWTDNPDFPLDGTYVEALLEQAETLKNLTPIREAEGPEVYGLYDARKYMTLIISDGTSLTYRFGKEEDTGCYVNSDENPTRICLAPLSILHQLGQSIYTMALLPDLPALSPDQIREVKVVRSDRTETFTVSGGQWHSDGQTDPAVLEAFLSAPKLTACADFAPSDGAAALCGLSPAALILEVTYDGGAYSLRAGSATGDSRFVTLDDDTTIYLMDAAPLEALLSGSK